MKQDQSRELKVGDKVAHRDDHAPFAFAGMVTAIEDDPTQPLYYTVEWSDEERVGEHLREDLIAPDDSDANVNDDERNE